MKFVPPWPSQPASTKVKLGMGFACCAAPIAVAPMASDATSATPPIRIILNIAKLLQRQAQAADVRPADVHITRPNSPVTGFAQMGRSKIRHFRLRHRADL